MNDHVTSIEDVNAITKLIKITIPAETVKVKFNVSLDRVSKNAKIKGFRQGKAPRNVLEKMYGPSVIHDVADKLIGEALGNVIREHSLESVGTPSVTIKKLEIGEPLEFDANVYIYPKPEIKEYDALEVTIAKKEVTDAEVDKELELLREKKFTLSQVTFRNIVQQGDIVDAAVRIGYDKNNITPVENTTFHLGRGEFLKEIEDGIIGLEVGTSKDIDVVLPKNHPSKMLRGRKVKFKVSISGISEKIYSELNDEFAASLDPEAPTLLALKLKIREQLEKNAADEDKSAINGAILDLLVQKNGFDVPKSMVDAEIKSMVERYQHMAPMLFTEQGYNAELGQAIFGKGAEGRVKASLILGRIAVQEDLKLSDEETEKARQSYDELLRNDPRYAEYTEEVLARGFENHKDSLIKEKVLDFLNQRTKVIYKSREEIEEENRIKEQKKSEAEEKNTD
jgi:trigger factor